MKSQLGIPPDKQFICLMVRDTKYLQIEMPDTQWYTDEYRNSTIENYIPAIEFLIKNNFYVVRMGKYVEYQLNIGDPRFIDYPNHSLRSDFMDIYLAANCFFFISTGTGIDCIPQLFAKPLVITNVYATEMLSYKNWFFTTVKNILCIKTQSLISFKEAYQDYAYYYLSGKYAGQRPRDFQLPAWEEKKWILVENTPDELLAVVQETLYFLLNKVVVMPEMKKMQLLFWKCCPYPRAPNEATYDKATVRLSYAFLKKHYQLMDQSKLPCEI